MAPDPGLRVRIAGYAIAVLIQIVAYGLIALALGLVMRSLWGDIAGTIVGAVYGIAVIVGVTVALYRVIVKGEMPSPRNWWK
ncbi:MAG TPA: hypothetical protein VI007_12735 [bacterium]